MDSQKEDSVEEKLEKCTAELLSLQRQLYETERAKDGLLYEVLDCLPEPTIQIGADHKVIWANRETLRQHEYAVGQPCYELFCHRNGPRDNCPCMRAFSSGRLESGVVEVWNPDGQKKYWDKIGIPVNNANGEPTSVVEICRDVTNKEIQQEQVASLSTELKKAQENAEIAKKAKSQFISNTSHEVRTPMNGIIGMIQLLERTSVSEEQQELLNYLKSSADRLMAIIDGILDISTLERDELTLIKEEFNVGDWLKYTISTKEKAALAKGLTLEYRIMNSVPDIIITDRYRLSHAVSNILENSIKFSRVGSVEITGECVRHENQEMSLVIRISDTGIGITEDKLDSIFESFNQVDGSSTREYGGAGIGLSISKKIVERMSGTIDVQSVYGVGTTFILSIPVEITESEKYRGESVLPKEESAVKNAEEPLRLLKILVAEDEMLGRITLKFMLKDHYEVIFAKNGKEAVERYFTESPDLVLMDIMMPQMNGFESFDEIEKRTGGKRVPIIACTAKVIKTEREYLISYGFDDYISKPIDMKKLHQILEKYLSESGSS